MVFKDTHQFQLSKVWHHRAVQQFGLVSPAAAIPGFSHIRSKRRETCYEGMK